LNHPELLLEDIVEEDLNGELNRSAEYDPYEGDGENVLDGVTQPEDKDQVRDLEEHPGRPRKEPAGYTQGPPVRRNGE